MKTECTSRLAFLNPRVLIGFALYAAGLVLAFGSHEQRGRGRQRRCGAESIGAARSAPGRWRVTGDLHGHPTRHVHTATLLPNGQVLVAGGMSTVAS